MVDLVCVGAPESRSPFDVDFGAFDGAIDEDTRIILLIGEVRVLEEYVEK